MNAHSFLVAMTTVLAVAAITTIVFQWLKQPVVLGYILAGFIVGPNVPIPLVADRDVVHTLSELGVILLMFSLGLEFSLGKLLKVGATAGLTALLQSSLMVWLGFLTGQLFGWTTIESLFAGAIIAISSTTIIAKAFEEQRIRGSLKQLVVGVLIVEDLVAILLMATLTAVVTGAGLSARSMVFTVGKLALFLILLVSVGLFIVPRFMRLVRRLGRPETTLVASIGLCFAISLLAEKMGYSVALGAFIAGSLIAESGQQHEIQHLVEPVRDVFAAIFFVSVGILIDPRLILTHYQAILVLTGVVIVGKILSVSFGAFLTGNGVPTSVRAGMSLAQIGEFSFIIAGLGLSLGATRSFLYPVAVAVSAITTLTTPHLIRVSGPVASFVDRKLPGPLQTFVSLYASWIEKGRHARATRGALIRRLIRHLVVDTALFVIVVVGATVGFGATTSYFVEKFGLEEDLARGAVALLAVIFAVPLGAGMVRVSQRLGFVIAEGSLPSAGEGKLDLAAAPRRALVLTLQLGIVVLTGLPVLAVTQPLIGGYYAPAIFVGLLVLVGIAFWRGASNLHEHVRAGAETIVETLLAQARTAEGQKEKPKESLAEVHMLLPGLGEPTPIRLEEDSDAVGQSLQSLNLRGVTGATVLALIRDGEGLLVPTATETLRVGDVLALAGSQEAIGRARRLLEHGLMDEPSIKMPILPANVDQG
jgi:CPA2 family monovalent cation:H+ antiporter-2